MDSAKVLPLHNEARTCGVATARSGRPSGKPSDARSSSDVGVRPSDAEPGTQGRPDNAGVARVRVPRDPAEGRERARKTVSLNEAGALADGDEGSGGGGVTPPSWHHLPNQDQEPELPNPVGIVESFGIGPASGPGAPQQTGNRKHGVFGGYPPGTTNGEARLLARRVDALVLGYRVHLFPALVDELGERQAFADLAGGAELKLASGIVVALGRSRRHSFHAFQNADARGAVDLLAPGGWILEVILRAVFLATHPLREALEVAERVAAGFGEVVERRLRRFDLCADFVGWPLRRDDAERFSTRAGKASFFVDSKDVDEVESLLVKPAIREFSRAGVGVTGLAFASGNELSARIYAKSFELGLAGREAKREIEHALWRANAWQGEDVTRLEFQHRGGFLDEIKLRGPHALEANLDAVWAYDTQRFLRMKVLGSASRLERCSDDPRWLAARTAFEHEVSPIARTRALRGGASAAQVVGATLSHSAAAGTLERAPQRNDTAPGDDLGRALDEALEALDVRARLLDEVLRRTAPANARASEEFVDRLLLRSGPEALKIFYERVNGLTARFWSVDDETRGLESANVRDAVPAKGRRSA